MKKIVLPAFLFFLSLTLWARTEAEALLPILKANDEVFAALLGSDQTKVESTTRELLRVLSEDKSKLLAELTKTSESLKKISRSRTKDQNIASYGEFIPALIKLNTKYRPDVNYQLFYCPMIKRYWIQDTRRNSSVKNVFAQYMLECGEKI